MNERGLKRLAMGLAAALVLWGVLALSSHAREDHAARLELPRIDTAAVDTIALDRRDDSVVLARAAHGHWQVNGHPADSADVRDLLGALVDTTAWGELVAESRSSYARLGVDPDSGRHVRVLSHGKAVLDITTGKRTADWGGVYMRRGTDSAVYALHGNGFAEPFTRSGSDWRDKTIARVAPESVATAEIRHGSRLVTLQRTGGHWNLDSGAPADSTAVATMLDLYKDLNTSGFATPAQADSARKLKPVANVRLRAKSGALLLGLGMDSTANGVWARADSGGPVFRLDTYQLSHLAPPESTFKAKKEKKAKK
jgi:hypothetical protein